MRDLMRVMLSERGKRAAQAMAVLLLVATGLTASARAWFSGAGEPKVKNTVAAVTQDSGAQEVRGLVRLTADGFSPAQLNGAPGKYRIAMTRWSRDEIVILVRSAGGETLKEMTVPQGQLDWTTLVELGSGSYVLKVANHPEWVCQITVQ